MIVVLCSLYKSKRWVASLARQFSEQVTPPSVVVVRDDSPTGFDSTSALKTSLKNIDVIDISDGRCLGAKGSFFELLAYAYDRFDEEAMFVLSDHDDLWSDQKILRAYQSFLKTKNFDRPWIHAHNYTPFDSESGTEIESLPAVRRAYGGDFSISSVMLWNPFLGCTMSFNRSAVKGALEFGADNCTMHDRAVLLATLLAGGEVITERESLLKYRQHENNTVGLKMGIEGVRARVRSYSSGYYLQSIRQIERCKTIADTSAPRRSIALEVNLIFKVVNGGLMKFPAKCGLPFRKRSHALIFAVLSLFKSNG
jgi:hypothetical protein